jgi:hypothetical protein
MPKKNQNAEQNKHATDREPELSQIPSASLQLFNVRVD